MRAPPELANAACSEPATAVLFAAAGSRAFAAAKAVCNRCWARPECLAWGLDHEKHGVWGGHGPTELAAIRKKFGITLEEI